MLSNSRLGVVWLAKWEPIQLRQDSTQARRVDADLARPAGKESLDCGDLEGKIISDHLGETLEQLEANKSGLEFLESELA